MLAANGTFIHPRIDATLYRLIGVLSENYAMRDFARREAARLERESGRTIESWIWLECWAA